MPACVARSDANYLQASHRLPFLFHRRGYTLASSPRSNSTGADVGDRLVLLLDNLSVTPSWGITTARELGGVAQTQCNAMSTALGALRCAKLAWARTARRKLCP